MRIRDRRSCGPGGIRPSGSTLDTSALQKYGIVAFQATSKITSFKQWIQKLDEKICSDSLKTLKTLKKTLKTFVSNERLNNNAVTYVVVVVPKRSK